MRDRENKWKYPYIVPGVNHSVNHNRKAETTRLVGDKKERNLTKQLECFRE